MQLIDIMTWERAPRTDFLLRKDKGLYALFLRAESSLPIVTPGRNGLIYIGKASGRRGLIGRCHFSGNTGNHSPRKSLAFLLREQLDLRPQLILKPNGSATWGLEQNSEERLTEWMHNNLLLAVHYCEQPEELEKTLIESLAPPLKLNACAQSERHRKVSRGRESMLRQAKGGQQGG